MDTQEAIRSVVDKIFVISNLKSQQDECWVNLLNGNDDVALNWIFSGMKDCYRRSTRWLGSRITYVIAKR